MPRRLAPLIVAAVGVAFFIAPMGLRAVGVKAHCCYENRPFSPAPRLSDGWKVFEATTAFLTDRMPLRKEAVRANTWISQHVWSSLPHYGVASSADKALPFAATPANGAGATPAATPAAPVAAVQTPGQLATLPPEPVAGKDGWLFLQNPLDRDCHPFGSMGVDAARWLRLLNIIHASGRRVVLVVAPEKSAVYPEFLDPKTPNLACSQRAERLLWSTLQAPRARKAGVLAMLAPLLAAKARGHDLLYFRKDTHWNNVGVVTFLRSLLPLLGKVRVAANEVSDPGPMTYTGDLTTLLGAPQKDKAPNRRIRRARGAPVIAGHTLLVGDSFAQHAYPFMAPYFSALQFTPWGTALPAILQQIDASDTVIFEIIERNYDSTGDTLFTPQVLGGIAQQITKH